MFVTLGHRPEVTCGAENLDHQDDFSEHVDLPPDLH